MAALTPLEPPLSAEELTKRQRTVRGFGAPGALYCGACRCVHTTSHADELRIHGEAAPGPVSVCYGEGGELLPPPPQPKPGKKGKSKAGRQAVVTATPPPLSAAAAAAAEQREAEAQAVAWYDFGVQWLNRDMWLDIAVSLERWRLVCGSLPPPARARAGDTVLDKHHTSLLSGPQMTSMADLVETGPLRHLPALGDGEDWEGPKQAEDDWECEYCPYIARTNGHLRSHRAKHIGELPFRCSLCNRMFTTKTELTHHLLNHPKFEKAHTCPKCNQKFAKLSYFQLHICGADAPIPPPDPDSNGGGDQVEDTTAVAAMLKLGRAVAFNPEPAGPNAALPIAGATFDEAPAGPLQRQPLIPPPEAAATAPKPANAPAVTKAKQAALKRKSTNPKQFPCKTCGKVFSQSGNLRRHQTVHTKDRPFVCPICKKGFTQRTHMKTHIDTHNGTKRFQCQICSKKLSQLGHLRTHMEMHRKSQEKETVCPVCLSQFLSADEVKKHQLEAHPELGRNPSAADGTVTTFTKASRTSRTFSRPDQSK